MKSYVLVVTEGGIARTEVFDGDEQGVECKLIDWDTAEDGDDEDARGELRRIAAVADWWEMVNPTDAGYIRDSIRVQQVRRGWDVDNLPINPLKTFYLEASLIVTAHDEEEAINAVESRLKGWQARARLTEEGTR